VRDVFWIDPSHNDLSHDETSSKLAIVLRPRGDDWLEDELQRLKRDGIQTLVSMLEPWEAESLGLAREGPLTEQIGLNFLAYPIPDRQTPSDVSGFRKFAASLADRARNGERIGVHCRGSIGRSTVIAASFLIHLGWRPHQALAAIEAARECPVPDTEEQEDWILQYEAQP
jgi:protein-tyrosine phosphatase